MIHVQIAKHLPKPLTLFFSSFSCSLEQQQIAVTSAVSILTNQRSKSRWNTLHSLYPNGFNPTDFSQITLHLNNKPHLALHFYQWTKSKSLCHHNLSSYSTIIHILARGRLYSHAYNTIRTALLSPETPVKLFEILVNSYRDCGSAPFVFDLLIEACLQSRKIEPSVEITRMLLSRGISPKVMTLNSLVSRVCGKLGVDVGYEIYREFFRLDEEKYDFSKRGFRVVNPNVHTFNTLMLCCYQNGLMEKVEEIWAEMCEMNCDPNAYSYSLLMTAFCEGGRMGDCEKMWKEMRKKEIEPDVVSYNTIIGGFCKIGDVGKAEEFFRDMGLVGIDATVSTYENLVKGYCNVDDVDSAVLVYKDMCRKDFRPDALTVDMVVRLLCDRGRVEEAMEFFKSGVGKFGLVPKEKSYEALIKGLCFEGKMGDALKLQAEMVGKGFEPNLNIYEGFIDGYIRQGNKEMAEALRKEMVQTHAELTD
ncbi:pentatricopeptide repeat-containing protein At2g15980-like [Vicia villosa]|uniref:pentatricopeptide repeat-containing protein At2g15980-like n=1 Tax=Vicia villosa TaxID=3911 RepID=UPI00273BF3D5|nr:pentatricopeptide repeat-containing protein At2g15980-like [Vicia villosa]XP_058776211.1 pentatricopeptide repeat-containing protein At2g15980-like [Vicia villosa]XP_058776212.1 pentatricopeptide repeat-containing protein At2g15980-like [Vicia villosa]XP_058776213.1 pentatricopeptide repeat-containing protein At2g15980-like [Vicia villosa]